MLNSRLPTSDPPTPGPHGENHPQVVPGQKSRVEEHTPKCEASGSIQDLATTRMTNLIISLAQESTSKSNDSRTSKNEVLPNSTPDALDGEYGRGIGSTTINKTGGSNTGKNPYSGKNTIRLWIPGSGPDDEYYWFFYIFLTLYIDYPGWPAPQTRREPNPYRNVELLWQYSVWERHFRLS